MYRYIEKEEKVTERLRGGGRKKERECVCVRDRQREREREKEKECERGRLMYPPRIFPFCYIREM